MRRTSVRRNHRCSSSVIIFMLHVVHVPVVPLERGPIVLTHAHGVLAFPPALESVELKLSVAIRDVPHGVQGVHDEQGLVMMTRFDLGTPPGIEELSETLALESYDRHTIRYQIGNAVSGG